MTTRKHADESQLKAAIGELTNEQMDKGEGKLYMDIDAEGKSTIFVQGQHRTLATMIGNLILSFAEQTNTEPSELVSEIMMRAIVAKSFGDIAKLMEEDDDEHQCDECDQTDCSKHPSHVGETDANFSN